jgi:hypothetical protein
MSIKFNSESIVSELVKKLWSSNDPEREFAKVQLSESGPEAIPPLLDLLFDLANHPHPRFSTGKETEGETAIKSFFHLVSQFDLQNQDATLSNHIGISRKKIDELTINHRLAGDTIFLLGKLKAREAVPFLIELMENRSMLGGYTYTDEMSALESIGPGAIPSLLKALTDAEDRVRSKSIEFIGFHYNLSLVQLDEESLNRAKDSLIQLADDDHHVESEVEIKRMTYYIQSRALMILRRMKAHQAIPDLEKLLRETKDEELKPLIRGAIKQIRSPYPEGTIGIIVN